MRAPPVFQDRDLESIRSRGLQLREALDQIERLRRGSGYLHVLRAATIGDGIEAGDAGRWDGAGREAIAAGRCGGFVPASGAATRMFQDLIAAHADGVAPDRDAPRRLLDELPRFAFHEALAAVLERRGKSLERLRAARDAQPILEALLGDQGLGYANVPKGLVLFHRTPDGPRAALEEHLVDTAATIRDADGIARIHFTVSPEYESDMVDFMRQRAEVVRSRSGALFELGFSSQDPASHCVAVTPEGEPFRDAAGALVFRPGGHGALLPNLARSGGDLVVLRNVDNFPPHKEAPYLWIPRLLGRLAELEREAHHLLERLDDPSDATAAAEAIAFAGAAFRRTAAAEPSDPQARARALLDRPIRVCGMVPNSGEPGGGPFWVRGASGDASLQIVEQSQVNPDQRSVFSSSTHFNPVFMACALRDRHGRPRDLEPFVDRDAVIVTRKREDNREILALEKPGLWNGAMAHWNTVFVEIPAATFAPVKTVFDLLRPEHQLEV